MPGCLSAVGERQKLNYRKVRHPIARPFPGDADQPPATSGAAMPIPSCVQRYTPDTPPDTVSRPMSHAGSPRGGSTGLQSVPLGKTGITRSNGVEGQSLNPASRRRRRKKPPGRSPCGPFPQLPARRRFRRIAGAGPPRWMMRRPLIARYSWPAGGRRPDPHDCGDDRISEARRNGTRSLSLTRALRVNSGTTM
jgi:hypothetical protein